jgi:hypothetical protein
MGRYDIALGRESTIKKDSFINEGLPDNGVLSDEMRITSIQNAFLAGIIETVEDFVKYKSNSSWLKQIQDNYNPIDFKKEFLTIKLGLPRRSGKTTIAVALLTRFQDALLIVANSTLQRELRRRLIELSIDPERTVIYDWRHILGRSAQYVIIDDASHVSREMMDAAYYVNAKFFILLG